MSKRPTQETLESPRLKRARRRSLHLTDAQPIVLNATRDGPLPVAPMDELRSELPEAPIETRVSLAPSQQHFSVATDFPVFHHVRLRDTERQLIYKLYKAHGMLDSPLYPKEILNNYDDATCTFKGPLEVRAGDFDVVETLRSALERPGQVRLPILAKPLSTMNRWMEKVVG